MVLVKFSLVYTFVIIFSLKKIVCEGATKNGTNCGLNIFCGDCLQQAECAWCIQPIVHLDEKQHCISKDRISLCPKHLQVNPKSLLDILSQKPLQSTNGNHVQLTPQKINMTMRVGEEQTIEFTYAQAKDYPIDLYYIMDYSASMERHREKLGILGNKLAETMRKITSDFRIGFGSFVDKTELPFTSTVPAKLKSPCNLNKGNNKVKIKCVSPYGFKNHMSLNANYTKFSIEVSQGKVSGNLDTPEGGFDAIMQAIVCKKEIGWRDKARHLLVFSTDADFHIAGDGKLTGVMLPNDAICHMSNDEYNGSLTYDYPSVSHLNYVAKKNNINLIFAIVNNTEGKSQKQIAAQKAWGGNLLDSYVELTKNIENSNVGALNHNSENVIDLVLQNYNKIVDTVVIDINSKETIEVKLTSNCTRPIERGCSDIHLGEKVKFTAVIKPMTCKGYNGKPITLTLKPEALDESLTIELNLVCGCDCENPGNSYYLQNSTECKNLGDLVCGVCKCLPGTMGEHCDCDERDLYSTKCIQSPGKKVCSGLGDCICGKCECLKRKSKNEVISGKYCQCDNYSCNQKNGLLCSGKGECSCGKCICDAGWNGVACDCQEGNSTCIDSRNSFEVCSGRGTCKCGKCECSETYFTGNYCEVSTKDRCTELRNCVDCKVFHTGSLKGEKCDAECSVYTIQEKEEISEDNQDKSTKICKYSDEETCSVRFKYSGDWDKYFIIDVQTQKSCPPNALVWILGVIGTIVLAGIIMLLIWKICTSIHDKREYVKFENERKNLKWHRNENPLYKNATTTFQNPVYSH